MEQKIFSKMFFDLVETLAYFYQISYPKIFKVWTKLDNLLLNKIFIQILILFFCITPYLKEKLYPLFLRTMCCCTKLNFQVRPWLHFKIFMTWICIIKVIMPKLQVHFAPRKSKFRHFLCETETHICLEGKILLLNFFQVYSYVLNIK